MSAGAGIRLLLRWVTILPITFLGLIAVTFVIGRIMPIDPVILIVGQDASKEAYDRVYRELGLHLPLYEQFLIYIDDVLRGDFGMSISTAQPVIEDIKRVVPATLELATIGTVIGTLLGVPMGIVAAARQGTWIDSTIRVVSLIGYSVPVFWKGLMLLLLFYAVLGWTAGPGRIAVYYDGIVDVRTGLLLVDSLLAGEIEIFWNAVDHMILPAVSLGYAASAYITRMTRSFMLDQLNQEYITTARVKGLAEWRVVLFHAFRNTLVQLVTVIALTYGILLEGSVLTETVFAWPGLGQYLTKALFNGDMNAVIGATIVIGAVFVTLNLTSDILYRMLDPRAQ
ncbi:ABC transporter permease [Pelagibius sp.]|uniref:ABC transporter permease n=1 Tax=Pelagibius sp. TaxID=1931238 RepID=UPI0026027961|nr:ABC transporter permease [Pelagibius sp.]